MGVLSVDEKLRDVAVGESYELSHRVRKVSLYIEARFQSSRLTLKEVTKKVTRCRSRRKLRVVASGAEGLICISPLF